MASRSWTSGVVTSKSIFIHILFLYISILQMSLLFKEGFIFIELKKFPLQLPQPCLDVTSKVTVNFVWFEAVVSCYGTFKFQVLELVPILMELERDYVQIWEN